MQKNHYATAKIVKEVGADFGVAFDGDFDRCFFFDENGVFVKGEYIVGLFADIFLEKEPGATIVHDPRVIWNTQNIVKKRVVSPCNQKLATRLLKKRCACTRRYMVVRCQHITIFVTSPFVTAAWFRGY